MNKVLLNGTLPICETIGGEPYEYFPLGRYLVRAPGICGGRPTFKYTRIEPGIILSFIAAGESIDEIVDDYQHPHLTHAAIYEALEFATTAFNAYPLVTEPLAATSLNLLRNALTFASGS